MTDAKPLGQAMYEQFADRYAALVETKAHNAYYERPATLSLLPEVNGKRVFDAGCGSGIYAEWLATHGAQVVAVDVTPRMVELTRQRLGDRVEARQADLSQALDFLADATFDLVVCPLVLDYIEDWGPTLREFYRVLRPGGCLVFSCGHPFDDWRRWNQGVYLDIERVGMPWRGFGEPIVVVEVYRRPLTAVITPLLEAGFTLERLLEPRPTEQFKEAEPDDYERLMRQPGFLCIRARK